MSLESSKTVREICSVFQKGSSQTTSSSVRSKSKVMLLRLLKISLEHKMTKLTTLMKDCTVSTAFYYLSERMFQS